METNDLTNLTLASTDELLRELYSRFDAFIFHGVKFEFKEKEVDNYTYDFTGGTVTAIGLCRLAEKKLERWHFENRELEGEDDGQNND